MPRTTAILQIDRAKRGQRGLPLTRMPSMGRMVFFLPLTSRCAMQATRPHFHAVTSRREHGGAAVEFALVVLIFLMLVFGILELARAMYICNTLQEVTRRAAAMAANTDFSNGAALQRVREYGVLRNSPGFLAFAEPVTDANVRIDYMAITGGTAGMAMEHIPTGSMPSNPAKNRQICMTNPNHSRCIRLVRVRVCLPEEGDACDPVPYRTIVSLVPLPFPLPKSITIVNAETLGMPPGLPSNPPNPPNPPNPCGC